MEMRSYLTRQNVTEIKRVEVIKEHDVFLDDPTSRNQQPVLERVPSQGNLLCL